MCAQVHSELSMPDQRGIFLETPINLLEEAQTRTSSHTDEFSVLKVVALPNKVPLGHFQKQVLWLRHEISPKNTCVNSGIFRGKIIGL